MRCEDSVCFTSLSCLLQKHAHFQVIWGESGNLKDQDKPDAIDRRCWRGFRIHTWWRASGWTPRGNLSSRSKTTLRILLQMLPFFLLMTSYPSSSTPQQHFFIVTVCFVLWLVFHWSLGHFQTGRGSPTLEQMCQNVRCMFAHALSEHDILWPLTSGWPTWEVPAVL